MIGHTIVIDAGRYSGIGLGVATVLAEAGANVHGQTANVAEQQSAELWPFLWPLEATLDALCTLGAQAIRGVKRLLFASFSYFSGNRRDPGIDLQSRCSID
jgi:NAD(P)-dependent dehydrogenase (short-subunit alcohol dehydrogenase family)